MTSGLAAWMTGQQMAANNAVNPQYTAWLAEQERAEAPTRYLDPYMAATGEFLEFNQGVAL